MDGLASKPNREKKLVIWPAGGTPGPRSPPQLGPVWFIGRQMWERRNVISLLAGPSGRHQLSVERETTFRAQTGRSWPEDTGHSNKSCLQQEGPASPSKGSATVSLVCFYLFILILKTDFIGKPLLILDILGWERTGYFPLLLKIYFFSHNISWSQVPLPYTLPPNFPFLPRLTPFLSQ